MEILERKTINAIVFASFLLIASCSIKDQPVKNPTLNDAKAFWSMGNAVPGTGMKVKGNVIIGSALRGSDRKASIERGGKGKVADFKGGYIDMGQGKDNALNFGGYNFTLHIRFCIPDGKWDKTIISKGGVEDSLSWKLYGRPFGYDPQQKEWEMANQNYYPYGDEEGKGYALEFELGVQPQPFLTEERRNAGIRRHNTFRIGVPVTMIGSKAWHDVTVRFSGPRIELFVDGVLTDEEWPIGKLRMSTGPCLIGAAETENGVSDGFMGKVDFAAIWERALSDDEITALAGGKDAVAEAKAKILGAEQTSLQYWRPRGHNIWVGDVVPAYNNGRFHMFYLYDRRHHGSKWGAGAHQFAHYSTTNLVHWEKHPMALAITRQWETFGTGCPIFVDNRLELHYGLHTTRFFDDRLTTDPLIARGFEEKGKYVPITTANIDEEWLTKDVPIGHAVAVSEDGVNFNKLKMVLTPAQNMCVFYSGEKKQFGLLYDNKLSVSKDLREWEPTNESFLPTGKLTSANNSSECPNFFEWNGWYYILMGGSGFWMSKEELGNYWEGTSKQNKNVVRPRWDIYDGTFVPMVASFTGNRRLLAGWTFCPPPHENWGGYLVFRELIQYPDGTLGMKWPEEMIPETTSPLKWIVNKAGNGVVRSSDKISISTKNISKAEIKDLPLTYRFTADIVPKGDIRSYGIQFNPDNKEKEGCELQFGPNGKHAQWGSFKADSIARYVAHTDNRESPEHPMCGGDFALENVEGLNEPFKLDIIVKYDKTSDIVLIDASIDQRRTMITHRYKLKCTSINLFAVGGEVDFENIVISPLRE